MTVTDSRKVALAVITAVRERSAYAHDVLSAVFDRTHLAAEDRRFATLLAYGVIQSRGTLEEVLGRSMSAGTRLDPEVEDALLVPIYERIFLHKQDHVVVSQGVDLVKSIAPRASGLANAILRTMSRVTKDFPWGDPGVDIEAFARSVAHPLWLAKRLESDLGHDVAREMMRANNLPAPFYVGVNAPRTTDENAFRELEAEGAKPQRLTHGAYLEDVFGCIKADNPSAAISGEALSSGDVVVCDAAAQEIAQIASPKPGESFCEVGAGRGTKTVLFQSNALRAGGLAEIHTIDLHGFKTRILEKRMDALGIEGVRAYSGDARDFSSIRDGSGIKLPKQFDAIFIDAPCSGLGTVRRHPEKRWRITESDITAMAQLGYELVCGAAPRVRTGGYLTYSTCTVTREENEQVIERFLASEAGAGFKIDKTPFVSPATENAGIIGKGHFGTVPVAGGPDGHFAVRLIRTDEIDR